MKDVILVVLCLAAGFAFDGWRLSASHVAFLERRIDELLDELERR